LILLLTGRVELTADERAELLALVNSPEVSAAVATRARIVLWRAEDRPKKEIAALAGVSRPTVDLWLRRYGADGVAGLLDQPRGAGREQMPAKIRARILAATRTSPPEGLSHWSSREMAAFIERSEGVYVSHHYAAKLWRQTGLRPDRQGTFKISRDPEFAEKVADIVGLYLDPPGGAVVLSLDEKTQIQALDRTQPLLPITFDATEQRTHDYVRHGTTNLFAALNIATGEVYGECRPIRDGANFLAFLKKAVRKHAGKEIHNRLDQHQEARRQQREVNPEGSRDTSLASYERRTRTGWLSRPRTAACAGPGPSPPPAGRRRRAARATDPAPG